jgi:diguanylate cyclase (GGDEF)-like protein
LSGDSDGSVWIGTYAGLNRWKNGKLATYTTRDGLPNNNIRALCPARQGGIWIGTSTGLGLFRNGSFGQIDKKANLSMDNVQALYEDRDQTLWIGIVSGKGLVRFRDDKLSAFGAKDGLSGSDVMSISGDESGNLWVGTIDGGLNRFNRGNVSSYTSKDGLPSDVITATFQDRNGDLWLGTSDRGLGRLRDGKFTNYGTSQGLSSNTVFSIAEDFEQNIWVGTRKGLNRFKDGRSRSYTTRDGLAGDAIFATHVDRNGTLWAGGRGGLSQYKDGRFIAFGTKEGLSGLMVTSIIEDATGGLWIGTNAGLSRIKGGRIESPVPKSNHLSYDYVLSLHEDPKDGLWIGTNGHGLSRLKNGRVTDYTTAEGLFDDKIVQILDAGDGNLWMSTLKGIFYVKKQQLDDLADGKIRSINSVAFGTEDGMKSKECNGGFEPAGLMTREGRLVFPTMKGISIIDPKRLKVEIPAPLTLIESVTVDSKPVPVDAPAVSPPGRGDLEFQFTAPVFVSPQKVRFQYRLEGYDRDWVDASNRRVARYTNIPAGTYLFRVRARNDEGRWNDVGSSFNLVLRPHFYRTYWFYTLCALTGLALVVTLLQAWVKHLKVRQQQLVSLVDQRTRELQAEILVRKQTEEDLRQARDEAYQARDELHFQANHDEMTGFLNRRAIIELLNLEIERANRSQSAVGVLMLDVDHFKRINDTHGHPIGDVVLREVTRRISHVIRSYDSAGRYGGEEFLVVLPGCDKSESLRSAERIRSEIADCPVFVSNVAIAVTVSIGTSVSPCGFANATKVLAAADAALYLAKNGGRNRTADCDCAAPS